MALAASSAEAATVDTFSFLSSTDWTFAGTSLSGSFTGTVEPNGFIELNDLQAFQVIGLVGGTEFLDDPTVGGLSFFSYDTQGGASSLGFIAKDTANETGCLGAPSVLSLACNPNGANPPSTVGVQTFLVGAIFVTTPDLPVITLVSSMTTIPEPSTWAMMVLGLAGLGFMRVRQATTPA